MDRLLKEVVSLRREVLRLSPPEYFSMKDVARSFFGSLLLAFTFIFSSRLVEQTKLMTSAHVLFIIVATLVILTVEIYFIGYARVPNRRNRPFYEFWAKRIVTFYLVAWVVSFGVALLYAFNSVFPSLTGLAVFAVGVSLPASIGAAFADLLRSY